MGKIQFKTLMLLSTSSLLLFSPPAVADDTVKALIGGIVGSLIVEGVKEATKPREEPQQQQEQIEWSERDAAQHGTIQHQRPVAPVPDPRVREMQSFLSQSGFYSSTVDGIDGSSTSSAIRSWEKNFDQVIDGKITDDEMMLLRRTAEGKFTTKHYYDAAITLGIKSQQAYLDYVTADVNQFLKIAEQFSKDYKGEMHIATIANDLKIVQSVKSGYWGDEQRESFRRIEDFYRSLEGFNDFHTQKIKSYETERENARIEYDEDIIDYIAAFGTIHVLCGIFCIWILCQNGASKVNPSIGLALNILGFLVALGSL